MSHVHIVITDRGWILERLAKALSDRLGYVSYSTAPDAGAEIQYYVNYSAWAGRVSPIELAWFTHVETDPAAYARFIETARAMDHSLCHARRYADLLAAEGIGPVSVIPPGIDLDALRPVVKIGVVGRTYHTGRKGEDLVRRVMDVADIEWHFTGEGWPLPGRRVPDGGMAAFYNEMDYILVPALYEGGPMCVAEAAACGTPVIAPPVGWVEDFPHIAFDTGDENSLRRVLDEVVADRFAARSVAEGYSWDVWAERHDALFRSLLAAAGKTPAARARTVPPTVALVLHGSEVATGGGPTVRVPATAQALAHHRFDARVVRIDGASPLDRATFAAADIIHLFNAWPGDTALSLARQAKAAGKPLVVSPIYLDHRDAAWWQDTFPALLAAGADMVDIAAARDHHDARPHPEWPPGHDATVRELVRLADHVVFLSDHERTLTASIGAVPADASIVRNAIAPSRFAAADPAVFEARFGVRDFVLCPARIEPRKNQLGLLRALANVPVPVVLMGAALDDGYRAMVMALGRPDTHLIGRIDPDDPLLASAFAAARVVALPSWTEGVPLAALEGAAAGTRLVVSDRWAERETFGDRAAIVDPGNLAAIREAVRTAYAENLDASEREASCARIRAVASYDRHARELAAVYEAAAAAVDAAAAAAPVPAAGRPALARLYLDVTDAMTPPDAIRGAGRVARAVAGALRKIAPDTGLVAFHAASGQMIAVDPAMPGTAQAAAYLDQLAACPQPTPLDAHDTAVIAIVDGRTGSPHHRAAIRAWARDRGARLAAWVLDMAGVTQAHLAGEPDDDTLPLIAAADMLLAGSEAVADALRDAAAAAGLVIASPRVVAPGSDRLGPVPPAATPPAMPYLLAVGTLDERRNPRLVHEIMRRLVRELGDRCPRLVVVGDRMREAEPARALLRDPLLAGRVDLVGRVGDAELDWLYRGALLLLHPALADDAASPVHEALARGRVVLVADTVPLTPAAATLVNRIDPVSAPGWVACIRHYVEGPQARRMREDEVVAGYAVTGWAEAATAMRAAITTAPPPPATWNVYTPGETMIPADRPGLFVRRDGWHGAEPWGAWMARRSARLGLRLPRPVDGDLTLIVRVTALLRPGEFTRCTIRIAGAAVVDADVGPDTPGLVSARIPAELLGGRCEVDIVFECPHLVRIGDIVSNTVDQRDVGLGIGPLILAEAAYAPSPRDFDPGTFTAQGALAIGETLDCVRDPRAPRLMPGGVVDGEWGLLHPGGAPALTLPVPDAPGEELALRLRWRAVADAGHPLDAAVVAGDGTVLDRLLADDDTLRESIITVPAAHRSQPMMLALIPAHPLAPSALGLGAGGHAFGLGLFSVEPVTGATRSRGLPAARCRAAANLRFTTDADDAAALRDPAEWHDPEADGTRTRGDTATMTLRVLDVAPGTPVEVRVMLRATHGRAAAMRVGGVEAVWIDGALTALVPGEAIGEDGMLRITLAAVPDATPRVPDGRAPGLVVHSLTATPRPVETETPLSVDPEVSDSSQVVTDGDVAAMAS